MMSLGATRKQTYRMVLWQLGLLGTGAALLAIIFSLGILPLLPVTAETISAKRFRNTRKFGQYIICVSSGWSWKPGLLFTSFVKNSPGTAASAFSWQNRQS